MSKNNPVIRYNYFLKHLGRGGCAEQTSFNFQYSHKTLENRVNIIQGAN